MGFCFQGRQNLSADSAAATRWIYIHAFDLGDGGLDAADCSAADRLPVEIGNEKTSATFANFFGVEAKEIGSFLGIPGLELRIQRLNKLLRSGSENISAANLNPGDN